MVVNFTGNTNEVCNGIREIADLLGVTLQNGGYEFELIQKCDSPLLVSLNNKKRYKIIRQLALMGLNTVMMYFEDGIEEPIKWLNDYHKIVSPSRIAAEA